MEDTWYDFGRIVTLVECELGNVWVGENLIIYPYTVLLNYGWDRCTDLGWLAYLCSPGTGDAGARTTY